MRTNAIFTLYPRYLYKRPDTFESACARAGLPAITAVRPWILFYASEITVSPRISALKYGRKRRACPRANRCAIPFFRSKKHIDVAIKFAVWLAMALLIAAVWLHVYSLIKTDYARAIAETNGDLANLTKVTQEHA